MGNQTKIKRLEKSLVLLYESFSRTFSHEQRIPESDNRSTMEKKVGSLSSLGRVSHFGLGLRLSRCVGNVRNYLKLSVPSARNGRVTNKAFPQVALSKVLIAGTLLPEAT